MEPQDSGEEDGANIDLDAQRKGKCAVIKTSTRQVLSFLIIDADVCLFWKKKSLESLISMILFFQTYSVFFQIHVVEKFFFNESLLLSDIFSTSHRPGWSRETEPRRHCGETKIPVFGKHRSVKFGYVVLCQFLQSSIFFLFRVLTRILTWFLKPYHKSK